LSTTTALIIAVVTLLNIAAAVWLLWALRKGPTEAATTTETTGHVWDGDLREYNNPLPRWWLWLFILTVVFGLGYFVLYPGLGNWGGTLGWNQYEQYRQQTEQAEAVLARTFAPYEPLEVAELMQDGGALRVGRNLFLNNCATCHGSDGRGAPGFPNLADTDWKWGGEPDVVLASIRDGRMSAMTPWGDVLGATGVEDVLAYTLGLSGRSIPTGNVARGARRYAEYCAACHGADGTGNRDLGAPNLTDSIWIYGGSVAAVRETIVRGRMGEMPAHLDRLGEVRTKLIAAYVLSLGAPQPPAPAILQTSTAGP
jgi:cytochrome c oxidase cbb3-type subunit III